MFENTTENSICGDVPDRNHKSSLKQSNLIGASQINSGFNAGFNASGALEQLSDLLSLHAKGGSMNGFKGTTPTIPVNDLRGDEAIRYSRDQRLIRCQLASLCRLIDLNGWTNSIYNQISAKSGEDEFLVNPFGLLYHEVQASTLVKINSQGNVLDPGSTVLGVNKASWNLHSAVHSTRSDVNCVVNVNLPDVVAVSCIKSGLLPVSPEAVELLPNVRYHDYAGMVTDKAEADAIRNDLGNAKILFLRNKGVTVAASTIPEAWYLMKRVISACQTQMRLLQLGCSANLLSELVFPTGGEKVETGERLSENNGDDYQLQQNSVPFASEANGTACDDNNDCDDHLNGVGAKSTSSGVTDLSGWGVGEMEFEAQMRMLDSAGYRTGYIYRNPSLLRRPPAEVPWSTNGQLAGADSSLYAGTGFLSDCTAGPDASDIDDITAATQAGAKQISEIASTVRSNKEKGVQRNQWLAKPGIGSKQYPETVIEEPRTPPTTPRSDLASKSASLPANARNLVNFSERSYNTMVAVDGAASDDEEHKAKVDKKKGGKWGSFRFPTFRKKTKPVAV